MKKKHFYSHLISYEQVKIGFYSLNLSEEEQEHLFGIISTNVHYTVLDTVLSHLDTSDKETFLAHAHGDDHDKTWGFLKGKIEHIEEKIVAAASALITEVVSDIKAAKKRNRR